MPGVSEAKCLKKEEKAELQRAEAACLLSGFGMIAFGNEHRLIGGRVLTAPPRPWPAILMEKSLVRIRKDTLIARNRISAQTRTQPI